MIGGSEAKTADGVVGTSGRALRVFSVVAVSDTGVTGELVLRNGTTDAGTVYVQQDGTEAMSHTFDFGENGLYFPGGCFYDHDADFVNVVINFVHD